MITVKYHLGEYTPLVEKTLNELKELAFTERLLRKDATLWKKTPEEIEHIRRALGWLDVVEFSRRKIPEILELREELKKEGINRVVLVGMGGSSLAPLMFSRVFERGKDCPSLTVVDSTDPHHIRDVTEGLEPENTLFIVASKSGTTLEVLTLFEHFHEQTSQRVGARAGRHFVAITDEGTPLAESSEKLGFRRTFINPSDIGGRYSALSLFGLVPAVLMGVDAERLLQEAERMFRDCLESAEQSPGLMLGVILGVLAQKGRDKLTFLTTDRLGWFALWLEQLIAESTGKDAKGVVPVALEQPLERYSTDRLFVSIGLAPRRVELPEAVEPHPLVEIELADVYNLGAEFVRWQVATACCGAILGINPFDQPDVEETKRRTGRLLKEGPSLPEPVTEEPLFTVYSTTDVKDFFSTIKEGWYVGLLAYIPPDREEFYRELEPVRTLIGENLGVATQFGYGPRYLHSTGQLHKGGTPRAVFIMITHTPETDIPIPRREYTFGRLILSQAFADRESLEERGRKVLLFNLKRLSPEALKKVVDFIKDRI